MRSPTRRTRSTACRSAAAASPPRESCFSRSIFGVFVVFVRNPSLFTGRALLEFAVVLVVSFCLGAFGKMIALAFTRWQFARRCREQYEELSRMLREPAVLS